MRIPTFAFALLTAGALAAPAATLAQTANSSPTAGGGAGNVARTAPSGSTAVPNPGQPQIGAPTAAEQHYEHKAQKDTTSVCKGC